MTLPELVLLLMWVGVTLYALLAGADFGAGLWDPLSGRTASGARQRALIEHSMAPVWEANHVWLIFVLVVLWTGFPEAFAATMSTLYLPWTAVAIGVIARGAGFALRKASGPIEVRRLFGATFAVSSLLTPYFLGAIAGAVASGRVPAGETGDVMSSWVNATSILGGVLAVVTCAFLAAVYLCRDAERAGQRQLTGWFRTRALVTGLAAGATALVGVSVLVIDTPTLFDGITGRAAPLIAVSVITGTGALLLVWRRHYVLARVAAGAAVAAVIWGWALGQYPWLLVDELTIAEGAGSHATLTAMSWTLVVGAALFGPPLVWLLHATQRGRLGERGSFDDLVATPERAPTATTKGSSESVRPA